MLDRNNREITIDLLKGIAIISIMLCHAAQVIDGINVWVFQACRFGQLGCQVFFFFTGYLLSKAEKNKTEYTNISSFIKKKVGGIVIPWYLMIAIYVLITQILNGRYPDFRYISNTNPWAVIINILFLNGLFPFANNDVVFGGWYIGTLVIVWLIFPCLYKFWLLYGKKSLVFLMLMCIAIMILCGCVFGWQNVEKNGFLYFSIINQLPCILYGMIYFDDELNNRQEIPNAIYILATIVLIALFYLGIPFAACIYPVLVCFIIGGIWKLTRKFMKSNSSNRLMLYFRWCGENSLYIYLIHIIIVWHLQWVVWEKIVKENSWNPTIAFLLLFVAFMALVPCVAFFLKKVSLYIARLIKLRRDNG